MSQRIAVRRIDHGSIDERTLVAARMRETIAEVLGAERARAMFTDEWLLDRLDQHCDGRLDGAAFVAVVDGAVVGHSIVRRERDEHHGEHGYISTTYVCPAFRRAGVARALIAADERWFIEKGLGLALTHTHPDNEKLRTLFVALGYSETFRMRGEPEERFAELSRRLAGP